MVRLGVIGHGSRVSHVIRYPIREVEPQVRVVAIVDPDEEGARSRLDERERADVAFYPSLDEMVRQGKLDALMVGTRCNLHTPYAIEAAKYDLPLFLEKPVATSMEQATALERAFEGSRCEVVVSFPLRVSPLCELTRQHIEEGAIGRADHVMAWNYVPYGTGYFDGRYRVYAVTQGLFLQKATHDFDYMMYLMGASITRVAAMAQWGRIFGGKKPAGLRCSQCDEAYTCPESPENRKHHLAGGTTRDHPCVFGEDIGTPETGMNEDASNALVEFANGAQGAYTQVFYTRRDAAARGAKVSGYEGTVEFDWYTNQLRRVRHHVPFSDTAKGAEGMGHFGGDDALAVNFIDVIRGRAKPKTPIETGLQSVYACLAAKESSETGRFVEVRQVGGTA
jgi:predicted dehydrogenase